MTDRYDVNAWIETCKETFASFSKAQAKAALTARAAVGTQAVADLLTRQAELSTQLSEKLRARAQEFSSLATEVQETVSNFAADAANRATGSKKAA